MVVMPVASGITPVACPLTVPPPAAHPAVVNAPPTPLGHTDAVLIPRPEATMIGAVKVCVVGLTTMVESPWKPVTPLLAKFNANAGPAGEAPTNCVDGKSPVMVRGLG